MATGAFPLPTCDERPSVDSAYGLLAAEYDLAEHRTTRLLETLSTEALRRVAVSELRGECVETILEVGAGTGALTRTLMEIWPSAHVTATDPSAEMLAVLAAKNNAERAGRLKVAVADAESCVSLCGQPPDLIAAGLADPYIDAATLATLGAICDSSTRLFITVPTRRWARRERLERLGISLTTTRFRTLNGGLVFAPSWAYDELDLRRVLVGGGFTCLSSGTDRSNAIWSCPEASWALAVRTGSNRSRSVLLVEDR